MTTLPPDASEQLAAFLSRFPAEIVVEAQGCLQRLRGAFPGTFELVYDYRHAVVVSFSPSDRGNEGVAALSIQAKEIRLYLDKDVPDPAGRLEGDGSKVRSVVIAAAEDLDGGEIHGLVQAAIRHAGPKVALRGPTQMVIKSSAKARTGTKTMTTAKKATAAKASPAARPPAAAKAKKPSAPNPKKSPSAKKSPAAKKAPAAKPARKAAAAKAPKKRPRRTGRA